MSRPWIGLALSGGGAHGLAHIGVLSVLERRHIPIDCLSGASMGGLIAAAYASGMTPSMLATLALRMSRVRRLIRLVDLRPPHRGLLAGTKLRAFLGQFIPPEMTFADLRLPLALEAVDLRSGEEVALTDGPVLDAVMATSSVSRGPAAGGMARALPGGWRRARQPADRPGPQPRGRARHRRRRRSLRPRAVGPARRRRTAPRFPRDGAGCRRCDGVGADPGQAEGASAGPAHPSEAAA